MVDIWNALVDNSAIVEKMLHNLRFHKELRELRHQILQLDSHLRVILRIEATIDLAEATSIYFLE